MHPVGGPGLHPRLGPRRIAGVTRRRAEARRDHPVGARPRAKGRPAQGGLRIAAPHQQVYGPVAWPSSRAWVDGRRRHCRDTQRRGRWAGRGPQLPGPVVVVAMAGDEAP